MSSITSLKKRLEVLEQKTVAANSPLPTLPLFKALMVFDDDYHATDRERAAAARSLDTLLGSDF